MSANRRRLSAMLLLAAAAVSGVYCSSTKAAVLAARVAAPGPVTFTNTPSSSGQAAGVTSVVVNNDAGGQVTFQLNFARALTTTDSTFVFVDSDQNPATGGTGGADYALVADENTSSWTLLQWNGTDWIDAPSDTSVHVTGGSGTSQVTFSVNRSEIGVTTGLNFWVGSSSADGDAQAAPQGTTWNYQLQAQSQQGATLRLTIVGSMAPRTVKAGGVYSAVMLVQRSDTLQFLGAEGQIQCGATVGGKTVAVEAASFIQVSYHGSQGSFPACAWQIPRSARGSTIRATITVSYQGARVTRHFSARVT